MLLTINNLTITGTRGNPERRLLDDLSMTLDAGELRAIIGPNGAGKSTLIKAIAGLIRPHQGEILFRGQPVSSLGRSRSARCIAYLPQNTTAVPCSVFDAVLLGRRPFVSWRPSREDWDITVQTLEELHLDHLAHACVTRLSGGEFQKVLIARALVQTAPLLLLDEPVNHLDIRNQLEILQLIQALTKKRKMAILIVLHDLNYALRYADQVLLLHHGQTIYEGVATNLPAQDLSQVYDIPISVQEIGGQRHVLF